MIYVIVNTKGGVGKTTFSVNLATLLYFRKRDFKVIELDNSQDSMLFNNSEVLNKDRAVSLVLKDKTKAIGKVMFNLTKNSEMDFIIDVGGGGDTEEMIETLKELDLPKTWIIPATSDKKYLKNAEKTYKLINQPDNTYFVLNRCHETDPKDEFFYFFGNRKFGVKPVADFFKDSKYFAMPDSNFYQIAEDAEQTILDLALLSIEKNEKEISDDFMKIAGDDEDKFIELWVTYETSKEAAKLFSKISKNAEILFN